VLQPGASQTQNISMNISQNVSTEETETDANVTQGETGIAEQSGLEETEKELEKDAERLSPLLKLKEITYKIRQNSGKIPFIIVDFVLVLLIVFVVLRIKKEKS